MSERATEGERAARATGEDHLRCHLVLEASRTGRTPEKASDRWVFG